MISFSLSNLNRRISTEYQEKYNQVRRLGEAFREVQVEADRIRDIPPALLAQLDASESNMSLVPTAKREDAARNALLRIWTAEHLGFSDAALCFSMPGPSLAMPVVAALASEQQFEWFTGLFKFDPNLRWAAFALSEPGLGSDFSHMQARALFRDGVWQLSGRKCYIGNASRARESIVFANAYPDRGRFGIRAFFVDLNKARVEDLDCDMFGLRCLRIQNVTLDGVEIPHEDVLGFSDDEPPKIDAFRAAQGAFNFMRPMLAAAICGTNRRLLSLLRHDDGAGHLHPRMDDCEVENDIALTHCFGAAMLNERGADSTRESAIAKYAACRVNSDMVQLTAEHYGPALFEPQNALLEKLWRDSYCFRFMEGTEENQKALITQITRRRFRFAKAAASATS